MGSWKSRIPNFLSLSRVFLSGLLIVLFSSKSFFLFCISMVIVAVAVITDILDGFLARRWGQTSELGYYLDGLGDKSFTVAICLIMSNFYPVFTLLLWALICREIFLYAYRILDKNRESNLKRLRRISLIHAALIRTAFAFFFLIILLNFQKIEIKYEQLVIGSLLTMACLIGWYGIFLLSQQTTEQ